MVIDRARKFVTAVNEEKLLVIAGTILDADLKVGEQIVKIVIYAFERPVRIIIGTYDHELQRQLESVTFILTMGEMRGTASLKRGPLLGFPMGFFEKLFPGGTFALSAALTEEI